MFALLVSLGLVLAEGRAEAAEQRIGGSVLVDGSIGTVTRIPRLGLQGGATWMLLGEQQGLAVDLHYGAYTHDGLWEDFPGLGLAWTARWGEGALRPYHALGASVELTALMPTALAPALPLVRAEGGADWASDGWWMRAGLAGFWTLAPAIGLGPRLSAGISF